MSIWVYSVKAIKTAMLICGTKMERQNYEKVSEAMCFKARSR